MRLFAGNTHFPICVCLSIHSNVVCSTAKLIFNYATLPKTMRHMRISKFVLFVKLLVFLDHFSDVAAFEDLGKSYDVFITDRNDIKRVKIRSNLYATRISL